MQLGDLLYKDMAAPVAEEEWVCLVDAVAGGDARALGALYQRTRGLVFTLAMRITGRGASAAEVTAQVFEDLRRHAPRYAAAGGSVIGWIMNL
ncbi:MAG TPA: hypothetical protein VL172_17865, partial [Kofleriaceae bacterium]|nr:hypothetical protein [Kofleriaceae bacterium]